MREEAKTGPVGDSVQLLVVVPTRNRADLAIETAKSILRLNHPQLRLVVSDNSTSEHERELMRGASGPLGMEVWRPHTPLPMSEHWNWALLRARADPAASHVSIVTDRMLVRPVALAEMIDILGQFPADVVAYGHDRLDDLREPVRLEINQCTGRVMRLPSSLQATLVAESDESVNLTLPRLLNCVVPKDVLHAVENRFGSMCRGTISPDFAFAFRCLATVPSTLFYDRSVLVHYAMDRSNGASVARGVFSPDHVDFVRELGGAVPMLAAPLPELLTVQNAVVHEYSLVRAGAGWPEVSMPQYLRALRNEVQAMEHGPGRRHAAAVLAAGAARSGGFRRPPSISRLLGLMGDALAPLRTSLAGNPTIRRLWSALTRRGVGGKPRWSHLVEIWPTRQEALSRATIDRYPPHAGPSAIEIAALRHPSLAISHVETRPDASIKSCR
jgi:hypothetical protein